MRSGASIMVSAAAGAAGGMLVMLLAWQSPEAARFFTGSPVEGPGVTALVGDEQSAGSYENLVVEAAEKASPAVVSIVITQDVPIIERYFEDVPATPFEDFFGNELFTPFRFPVPQYRERGTQQQEVGGGSGFLVSADGLIVTNRHVVSLTDADYTVFTNDGTKYGATIVARDPVNDLAILRIEATGLPFLQLAASDELKVGQTVIAIGNALAEFRNTVSVGVVSGLSRSILAGDGAGQAEQLEEVIQTDAAINPGNSGGPLLNLQGQVIGVNVAVALGSQNVGFALPVHLVRDVVESIQRTGRIVRPFLGVRYSVVTPALQQQQNLPVDYGAYIVGDAAQGVPAIVPGSPAAAAGLREGDLLLEIDGQKLTEETSLSRYIRSKAVGDTVNLKLLREGREQMVTVTLGEAPTDNE